MSRSEELAKGISSHDLRSLARAITIIENDLEGHLDLLKKLKVDPTVPVIGFTGPPGAGKSTLVNAFITRLTAAGKKVGVIAIDPTSPFNYGSILGDRIRMEEHFNDPNVFIRSVATRGSLGGMSSKTIEICDVMRSAGFDYVIVETVGVGQSEVEIAGLADVCVLVLVPEAGDEVQTIKSGIMEIADVFVINKSDRPGSDVYIKNIRALVGERGHDVRRSSIVKAVASKGEGVEELFKAVEEQYATRQSHKKVQLLLERSWKIIQTQRMRDLSKKELEMALTEAMKQENFNLYEFLSRYF
jgi:LAO/AO transport system kinase